MGGGWLIVVSAIGFRANWVVEFANHWNNKGTCTTVGDAWWSSLGTSHYEEYLKSDVSK